MFLGAADQSFSTLDNLVIVLLLVIVVLLDLLDFLIFILIVIMYWGPCENSWSLSCDSKKLQHLIVLSFSSSLLPSLSSSLSSLSSLTFSSSSSSSSSSSYWCLHENPRSLSSLIAGKTAFQNFQINITDWQTDGQTDWSTDGPTNRVTYTSR